MRLLLDTVTFLWSVRTPERISRKAMVALEKQGAMRELSALSLSEIAIKGAKGKLSFSKDEVVLWLADRPQNAGAPVYHRARVAAF